MSKAAHCDFEGCDTWTLVPFEHHFLQVFWGGTELDFCKPEHLIGYMLNKEQGDSPWLAG